MFTSLSERPLSGLQARKIVDAFINRSATCGLSPDTESKLSIIRDALSQDVDMSGWFRAHELACRVPVGAPDLGNVHDAVSQRINNWLLNRYCQEFHGVMIAYGKFALPESEKIMWDLPHIIIPLRLHAVVFGPSQGCPLKATLSKMAQDHLSLLVLDVFNAEVPLEQVADTSDLSAGTLFDFKMDWLDASSNPIMIHGYVGSKQRKREAPEEPEAAAAEEQQEEAEAAPEVQSPPRKRGKKAAPASSSKKAKEPKEAEATPATSARKKKRHTSSD
eukprot:m51a1_g8911 hypothetical protein (276) ;mRNA; f:777998-779288